MEPIEPTAERRSWYHTIELPDGTVTPGCFDTRVAASRVPWPAALRGGRCLDVGTFDGFWAFEMEKRGAAEVIALDVDDAEDLDWHYDERRRGPRHVREYGSRRGPGFAQTAAALGSSVRRVPCSVYELDPEVHGSFDVVFCGALLLHLRDPVRALEAMRSVCRGSLVLVEGLSAILDLVARRVPSARFADSQDTWWRVNGAGLMRMVEVSGFRVVTRGPRFVIPFGEGFPQRSERALAHRTLAGLAAGRPLQRGALVMAAVAQPRPPSGG